MQGGMPQGIVETMAGQRGATGSKAKEHRLSNKTEYGVWEDKHRTFKTLRLGRSEAKSTDDLEGNGQKASGMRGKDEPLPLTHQTADKTVNPPQLNKIHNHHELNL